MSSIINNWNAMRVIRLVLGIFILIEGVRSQELAVMALGGMFTLMPLLNVGCCSTAGCNTPMRGKIDEDKEIDYEELK